MTQIPIIADAYTFVDLDQDGTTELAVRCTTDYGLYLLFRYDSKSGNIYGYSIGARSFQDVKTDGTFSGSSGAVDFSVSKITFDASRMQITELANGTGPSIDGKEVSEEEFNAYWTQWENRESCEWICVTES